jgi:serine/threonine-protein kinase
MTYMLRDTPVNDFPEDPAAVSDYFVTPTTEVPLVVGLMQEDAADEIYDAHLSPNVVEVNSIEEQGVALTQDLEEGTEATHGQVMTIEVSSGIPPEAAFLDLRRLTVDQAVLALTAYEEETGVALGFSVVFWDTAEPAKVGIIAATDPEPGVTVQSGQTVTLFVGKFRSGDD